MLKDKFGEDFGSFGDAFLLAAMPMIRLLRLVRRFTYMQLLKAATWQQVATTTFNAKLSLTWLLVYSTSIPSP